MFLSHPSRVNAGRGCAYCAKNQRTPGEWKTLYATQGYSFVDEFKTSETRVLTRCGKGHEWYSLPSAIRRGRGKCPKCLNRHRRSQAEWESVYAERGLELRGCVANNADQQPARCRACGYEWSPLPLRVVSGIQCPDCKRLQDVSSKESVDPFRPGARSLTHDQATSLLRAAGAEPLETYSGMGKAWKSRCLTCGGECAPRLVNIKSGQGACNHCARRVQAEKRRIKNEDAIADMRRAGLEPLEPYPGVNKAWRCECSSCGETVRATLHRTRSMGSGCPHCAGNAKPSADEAVRIMRAAGAEPLEPFAYSHAPWKCQCLECGSIIHPNVTYVRSGGGACKPCADKRTGVERRLDEEWVIQRMRAAAAEPLETYPGRDKPWRFRCLECGLEGRRALASIRPGGKACTACTKGGIDFTALTALYVLQGDGIIKVGITNVGGAEKARYQKHKRSGLTLLLERYVFDTGYLAKEAESILVKTLQSRGGDACIVPASVLPSGHSESVFTNAFADGAEEVLLVIRKTLLESDTGSMIQPLSALDQE